MKKGSEPWSESVLYKIAIKYEKQLAQVRSSESIRIINDLREAQNRHDALVDYYMRTMNPEVVCVLYPQGLTPRAAALREAALHAGRQILSIENTFMVDRIVWDCIGGITSRNSLHHAFAERCRAQMRHEDFRDWIEIYKSRNKMDKPREHQSSPEHIDISDGYVLFLGQISIDSALFWGSYDG
jgi:hypothetical protein